MREHRLSWIGVALILVGGFLGWFTQTAGGIRLQDIRFNGANGALMSGLLYIPASATAKTPAPGILAVHGYYNARETHSAFAIEFARRGYVVLALDQRGHGYSDPPAFAEGFGGPDGLRYLRSLEFVDKDNIGLEGHSMGGWTVLAAAAAFPNGYKSLVLEGSSTGAPFAPEGTLTYPRNLAVVFSQYDEFAPFMWQAPRGPEVAQSKKLWQVFGTQGPVEPGKVYGSIDAGTARVFFAPPITHAQDHISSEAVGHAINWFERTLKGGKPLPVTDQIWIWKELGTLVALIGFAALLLGVFEALLRLPYFAPLIASPSVPQRVVRDGRWWTAFLATALLPALTFFPFLALGAWALPASRVLPQGITNELVAWAVLNGVIAYLLLLVPRAEKPAFNTRITESIVIAALTVAVGYAALAIADFLFKIDFRYWVVSLKLMNRTQFLYGLIYLIPFTAFFVVALYSLHATLPVRRESVTMQYVINIAALTLGFIVFLVIQYGTLFTTGKLILPTGNPLEALRTILAIQFVPLLATVALISTFTYRRTNSHLPGALICGLLVAWYIVAAQVTHAPV
jgi:pimeloyl-ACP methyl ester carboxylesterase